jgi:DNA-binding CsgD family transcriptional regulator
MPQRTKLNAKDVETLQLLADGYSALRAAIALGVGESSVRSRLKHARRILRAYNTTHAVAIAIRSGLIK